jgi:virginiamycin B lyase
MHRFTLVSGVAGLILVMASVGSAAAGGPPSCEVDCTTGLALPGGASPFGIARGPLGSEWFSLGDNIARVDQRGTVRVYDVPTAGANVGWVTTDPAGAVWFAERNTDKVGRITPDGRIVEFSLPTSPAGPQGIVLAPDGNVYVTEQGANAIARLDPRTGHVTDIPVPTPDSTTQSGALGPDGAIWFVERSADKVGRMTLQGSFTEYPLAAGSFPNRIVAGPDGALWFTELLRSRIGRITTDGQLTEYPIAGGPVGITVGKDGQLYTAMFSAGALDRIDLDGQITGHWELPGAAGALQVATGFGLDIWVTDAFGGQLFRVTPYAVGR